MVILDSIDVRRLLLELARLHDVDAVLDLAVETLTASPNVALARIWLIEEGDLCASCHDGGICTEKERCLHLRASGGAALSGLKWERTAQSSFSRFPMGVRKVGSIAKSGTPIEVTHIQPDMDWVANPEWIAQEKIVSFAGQPLICRDETLGVLAVFTRMPLERHALDMLRMIADHLAYALANARSFELIGRLKKQLEAENVLLREQITETGHFDEIIGTSAAMENVRSLIRMVSPTDANVLITGESGTGKELVAREIHRQSQRQHGPMIKINCAAIPRELFESEFFGHTRGAFTGAVKSRLGYFEAAYGGTLFLDEIGEMPVEMQTKLLRVLQEGEYRRVGEEKSHKTNVRIIAATNSNLLESMQKGLFREDLYYRLQVFPIQMPALRERKKDIAPLAEHFARLSGKKLSQPCMQFSPEQLKELMDYDWPGNIRELQNIVERITITRQAEAALAQLPLAQKNPYPTAPREHEQESRPNTPQQYRGQGPERVLDYSEIRDLEKQNLLLAIKQANGIIYGERGAAKALGINPTTLLSRLKKMGIKPKAHC